ncbi:uncharacterized protein LOC132061631 [Lycium ferocissimum]|uniref:uncharacterized protein LOC132061631 n=1 Tax=Lycium ferocissimum TaxID=112874 RepID=UPI0028159451|nr:uncharacterized protein LOC132061631 [Lycium ferocissimum]
MADIDTPRRNTRGTVKDYDSPRISLGLSQHQHAIAGESAKAKVVVELRSKKINNPSRIRQLKGTEVPKSSKPKVNVSVKQGSKVSQPKKRKGFKHSSDGNVDLGKDEQESKFYVKRHPERAPSMQCRTDVFYFYVRVCLYICNSYRAAGHDAIVRREIHKLATLLPHHLQLAGFYKNKRDIDFINHPKFKGKQQTDDFDIVYVNKLPQQASGSMDCGVHVAAFVEYLCSGRLIPEKIDAEILLQRYDALLWEYGWQKGDLNAFSDNELPPKACRPAIDFDDVAIVVLN